MRGSEVCTGSPDAAVTTDPWGLNGLCHVPDVLVSGYKTKCWCLIYHFSQCVA